jgi:hypothetical protein
MDKEQKPYTLAGFEPGIFCSGGGRDSHYATPPSQKLKCVFAVVLKRLVCTFVHCRNASALKTIIEWNDDELSFARKWMEEILPRKNAGEWSVAVTAVR